MGVFSVLFGAQKGDWTLTPCGIRVWDVRVYHSTTWAYCLSWLRGISTCTLLALLGVRLSNIHFTYFEPHIYHSTTWGHWFTDWIIASFYTLQALHLHKVLILELSFSVFLICKYHPISSYHSRNSMLYYRAIRSLLSIHSELDLSMILGLPISKRIINAMWYNDSIQKYFHRINRSRIIFA